MPFIETPQDLANALADLAGIYEDSRCHNPEDPEANPDFHHVDECLCRVYWVPHMAQRIRNAVRNEQELDRRCGFGEDGCWCGSLNCKHSAPAGGPAQGT